ncbi:hypothetical protein A6048_13990 [Dietzia psychralcaliphila]|uniref:Uncharacterized protein n=1 Tax=Dietzia psychralcaliphila TaxID=139021 RepID=A0AAD0NNX5_9ACTN|nr:hypothetical protein A6048_13990 [Dietzia psychralcaliphila]
MCRGGAEVGAFGEHPVEVPRAGVCRDRAVSDGHRELVDDLLESGPVVEGPAGPSVFPARISAASTSPAYSANGRPSIVRATPLMPVIDDVLKVSR